MPFCPICETFTFTSTLDVHKCPPLWEVVFETFGDDDWIEVRARDICDAAEKAAAEYDSGGDYYICNGNSMDVIVRKKGETEEIRVTVYGEMVPQYNANIKPGFV